MKIVKTVFLVFLLALLFVSVSISIPQRDSGDEAVPPASMSLLYRESEKILVATCMRQIKGENGEIISRFRVDEVIDGSSNEGDLLSVTVEASPEKQYLLYLTEHVNGEVTEYSILTQHPISVSEGSFIYEGVKLTVEALSKDIERQRKIITIPSQIYFYNSLDSLREACDEILIGRVISVSEPTETVCRSEMKGESIISTNNMVFVRVLVENDFSGNYFYGNVITVVLPPHNLIPILNETDLSPMTGDAPRFISPSSGKSYIFFLIKSDDKKRSDYFTVNPYEGYSLLLKNSIASPYYNEAMRGISNIVDFSRLINN